MNNIDPGHVYQLAEIDGTTNENIIVFVKREGTQYPGNVGHHPGTNCQELLRVLIDRVQYLNNQIPCEGNDRIIQHLRLALYEFELRAADRHNREFRMTDEPIELRATCAQCGHIDCGH